MHRQAYLTDGSKTEEENQSFRRCLDVLTDSQKKTLQSTFSLKILKKVRSEIVCTAQVTFLSVCLLFIRPACDDECSGLLISDMDRLYRIITEVTLTTPLPPPYKMLYRFENMTEGLKVSSHHNSFNSCLINTWLGLAATGHAKYSCKNI